MTQAVALVTRHAGVFLTMGTIAALIYLIPLLGGFIMLILGPALIGGSIMAARDAAEGRTPRAGQMFSLFQEDGRWSDALKLCVPLVVGKVLASLVIGVGITRVLQRAGLDIKALESQPELLIKTLQTSAGDLFGWSIVSLLIVLLAWAFTATALGRVTLQRAQPFPAMAESFRLALRHVGAWLLAAVALFLIVFVLAMPLLLGAHLLLAQILINGLIYSLAGPLLYFAWRDLFGAAGDGTPSAPSTSPDATQTPRGRFEA